MDKPADDLSECHEVVEQLQEEKKELQEQKEELQEENEQLRESADTFGELAERLSHALAEERQAVGAPRPPRSEPAGHDVKA